MRTFLLAVPVAAAALLACDSCTSPGAISSDAQPASSALAPPAVDAAAFVPANETLASAQRIAGAILVGGHAMDYLRGLTDLGPRLTGSDTLTRAGSWAEDAFRKAGVTRVAIEPFPIAITWTRHPSVARVVAPEEHDVTSLAVAWMPPTPPGGLRAELVRVTDLSSAGLKALGEKLRGKIAMFDRAALKSLAKKVDPTVALKGLKEKGAIGIAYVGSRDNDVLGASTLAGRDLVGVLPAVTIGKEDGAWITRHLEKGPVSLAFTNDSPTGGPAQVPDVVAEIRGREKPDEWVLVCAHLDSWDLATGAQDNGTGTAAVLEAARAIAALGAPPRRSIRFALWGGEEEGLLGSNAYAVAHAGELDRLVFVLNTDHGAGAPKGWKLGGREDVVPAFTAFGAPFLTDLGGAETSTDMDCGSDDCTFTMTGVPSANLDVDAAHYNEVHHTPGDTIEKVNEGALASAAAIVAVTAYAIADRPERLAARIDHAAVAKILAKAELVDELASGGYWKP